MQGLAGVSVLTSLGLSLSVHRSDRQHAPNQLWEQHAAYLVLHHRSDMANHKKLHHASEGSLVQPDGQFHVINGFGMAPVSYLDRPQQATCPISARRLSGPPEAVSLVPTKQLWKYGLRIHAPHATLNAHPLNDRRLSHLPRYQPHEVMLPMLSDRCQNLPGEHALDVCQNGQNAPGRANQSTRHHILRIQDGLPHAHISHKIL